MFLGRVVGSGPAQTLFNQPLHPYARGLIAVARAWMAPASRRHFRSVNHVARPIQTPMRIGSVAIAG